MIDLELVANAFDPETLEEGRSYWSEGESANIKQGIFLACQVEDLWAELEPKYRNFDEVAQRKMWRETRKMMLSFFKKDWGAPSFDTLAQREKVMRQWKGHIKSYPYISDKFSLMHRIGCPVENKDLARWAEESKATLEQIDERKSLEHNGESLFLKRYKRLMSAFWKCYEYAPQEKRPSMRMIGSMLEDLEDG